MSEQVDNDQQDPDPQEDATADDAPAAPETAEAASTARSRPDIPC